jgi:hypothetical protein
MKEIKLRVKKKLTQLRLGNSCLVAVDQRLGASPVDLLSKLIQSITLAVVHK